jgi:hypothetical protein
MAEINLKKLSAGSSGPTEIDVNFNGTLEGQADTTIPIEVNLTDGVNPVTPTSVALTGNDLDIVIPTPIIQSGVLFKTIEPSQYTSYRTGDEGWRVQNNWFNYTPPSSPKVFAELDFTSPNFFNVLKNPLVVNGVSSTTRFVDINGIQAFSATGNADLVVIDKLTGMMYTRTFTNTGNWNNTIDFSLTYSIVVNGITYSDWYVPTQYEFNSIYNQYAGVLSYVDTLTSVSILNSLTDQWSSSTYANNTTLGKYFFESFRDIQITNKSTTFSGSTLITNARNLITAP